jgi:hypothetical protein
MPTLPGLTGDRSDLFEECFSWILLILRRNIKPTTEDLFQLHETEGLGVTVEGAVNQVSPEKIKINAGLFEECTKPLKIMVDVGGEYQVHEDEEAAHGALVKG